MNPNYLNFQSLYDDYPCSGLSFFFKGKKYTFQIVHTAGLQIKEAVFPWLESKGKWHYDEKFGFIKISSCDQSKIEKLDLTDSSFCRFVLKYKWEGFDKIECLPYGQLAYMNLANKDARKKRRK